jgi:hypothetical protein
MLTSRNIDIYQGVKITFSLFFYDKRQVFCGFIRGGEDYIMGEQGRGNLLTNQTK